MVTMELESGAVVGTADSPGGHPLGHTANMHQSVMAWVPSLGRILVLTLGSDVHLYDPTSATFTGSLDLDEDGMAIGSVGVHAASGRIVTARTPETFTLDGPFWFSMHGPDGARAGEFGRGVFRPTWVLTR